MPLDAHALAAALDQARIGTDARHIDQAVVAPKQRQGAALEFRNTGLLVQLLEALGRAQRVRLEALAAGTIAAAGIKGAVANSVVTDEERFRSVP